MGVPNKGVWGGGPIQGGPYRKAPVGLPSNGVPNNRVLIGVFNKDLGGWGSPSGPIKESVGGSQ